MPDIENILKKLDEQAAKLDKIETAIVQMAVQGVEIKHLHIQMAALWTKTDDFYKPDGALNTLLSTQVQILERQSLCEVHSLAVQVKALWGTIIAMALGILVKELGGKI